MPDDAHDAILDRTLFKVQIADSFAPQLELLEQLVNYGTHLVVRCFNSSERGIPDTVALLGFVKHAITSLDAIHVLVKEGAVLSCSPHIRSNFEIDLYLRWIFAADYQNRGAAYFVWNVRQKRYWLRCYLRGTPEYQANIQHMQDAPGGPPSLPRSQAEIQAAIAQEDAKLACPETSYVNGLFEQQVTSSGRDREWYRPFGVSSVRDMARSLGEEANYKVFYSHYSQITHGLSLDRQMHFKPENREVVFDHIRTLDGIDGVFQMTFTYALRIFRVVLGRFRPSEVEVFDRRYKDEWRSAYRRIPSVVKDGSSFGIRTPNSEGS